MDQDPDAIALARENFTRNGLPAEKHDFLAADVFELIQSFKDEGRTFDLIILDPPAFAKSQRAVRGRARRLCVAQPAGARAAAAGRPAGHGVVLGARDARGLHRARCARRRFKAGVDLALVEERYQPPDHPVRLQFPEGKYLKFYVLQSV